MFTYLKLKSEFGENSSAEIAKTFSQTIADVVESMKWNTFAAIYQTNDGLSRIQKALTLRRKKDSVITIRRLGEGPDYRPILKEIRALSICNIIVDVEPNNIIDVLYQAKEVKLLADYCNFLITYLVLCYIPFSISIFRCNSTNNLPIGHNNGPRTTRNYHDHAKSFPFSLVAKDDKRLTTLHDHLLKSNYSEIIERF